MADTKLPLDPNRRPVIGFVDGDGFVQPVSPTTPLPVDAAAGDGAATIADGADVAQGAVADAVVAAGAAGTLSAKLRRLTTDLGTLLGHVDGLEAGVGTGADAAVAAGAAGSTTQQLRRVTTDLATVNTNLTALTAALKPATNAAAVTPSDDTDLAVKPTRAVWVGGAGNLIVIMDDGATVTFTAVPAGSLLPIAVDRVKLSTATSIVALY